MRVRWKTFSALAVLFCMPIVFSCSSAVKKGEAGYVIRYCDVKAVYRYLIADDAAAERLRQKRKKLIQEREKLKTSPPEKTKGKEVTERRGEIEKELLKLKKEEKALKGKTLTTIGHVLKEVARDCGADFIFNYGEGLLYGAGEYDVTEDVIRAFKKRKIRSAPVSR